MNEIRELIAKGYPLRLFEWIPFDRFLGISFFNPHFLYTCVPSVLLILLACSRWWARITDRPAVFTIVYSIPLLTLTFQNSLGDAVQWMENINGRYYMSEPGATWVHHWAYYFLHHYANVGVQDSIAWSSRAAGVLFLWLVAHISVRLLPDETPQRRLLFRLVYCVSGATLLFFGYVENTPIAFAVEQLWILCTIFWLRNPSWIRLSMMSIAFALATLCHGRIGFFGIPFGVAILLPPAPLLMRLVRVAVAGAFYLGPLAAAILAIFSLDRTHIIGGPLGNVTGGGNNTMFVPLNVLLSTQHWIQTSSSFLLSVGILAPCALVWLGYRLVRNPDRIILWATSYVLSSLIYLGVWEFDLGIFLDWDLIFSGAGALLFVSAYAIVATRTPAWLAVFPLVVTSLASLAFGMIANGEPFSTIVTPTASLGTLAPHCSAQGLKRTFYTDPELTQQQGQAEADLPNREWGPERTPLPFGERPFGARYEGYLQVPEAGKYWLLFMANGNVRVSVGGQILFERWSGFEWRVTAERALRFPSPGWYPVTLEFFTTTTVVPLQLSLESQLRPQHRVEMAELCH
jgi:hypothetical protein